MILVTGGAGFIGSHLVNDLLKNSSNRVTILDNLSGGFIKNVHPKAILHVVDLRDKTATEKIIYKIKPRIIYHLSADAAENRSFFTPRNTVENNINAFLNMIIPAIKYGVKKVIFTSSLSVYGNQPSPYTEGMHPIPADIYGISKNTTEQLLQTLATFYGFRYCIFRLHNVYGIGQNMQDPYRNVVAIFISSILRKKQLYIYGDGSQKRSFTYIKDCIAQLSLASQMKQCENNIYNLGSDDVHTVLNVAKTLCNIYQYPLSKIKFVDKRKGEVSSAFCDNSKLKSIISYQDQFTLSQGLKKMALHYKGLKPNKPRYIESLELVHPDLPVTWKKHLI